MTHSETPGTGDKATRTQERAIAALLAHGRLEDAARAAGMSRSTLCRMLQEPAFQAAFRNARRELLDAAIGRLQAVTGAAVEALTRNLTCRGKPSIEISAARAILDNHWRSLELGELEDRVRQLEEAIKLREGGRR